MKGLGALPKRRCDDDECGVSVRHDSGIFFAPRSFAFSPLASEEHQRHSIRDDHGLLRDGDLRGAEGVAQVFHRSDVACDLDRDHGGEGFDRCRDAVTCSLLGGQLLLAVDAEQVF